MTSISNPPAATALQDDIATLKRDVASLLEHMREGAKSNAESAISQLNGDAQGMYRAIADEGTRSTKALAKQIEEHPVITVLIALGLAYVGGRLLLR